MKGLAREHPRRPIAGEMCVRAKGRSHLVRELTRAAGRIVVAYGGARLEYGTKTLEMRKNDQCSRIPRASSATTRTLDARTPHDAPLGALRPRHPAVLRAPSDAEHVRLLCIFVRDGPSESDGRGDVAAERIQEAVEAQRAVVLGNAVLRESLVERGRAAGNRRELKCTRIPPLQTRLNSPESGVRPRMAQGSGTHQGSPRPECDGVGHERIVATTRSTR